MTMKIKNIFTLIFGICFLSVCGFLLVEILKPEVLPIGSAMPKLRYYNGSSFDLMEPDSTKRTILMIFHKDCEHCQYMLNQFNSNAEKFEETRVYLITPETDFLQSDSLRQKWPVLACLQNVYWGVVEKNELVNKVGRFAFPAVYIFNSSSRLCFKIKGEIKMQNIFDKLKILNGPER